MHAHQTKQAQVKHATTTNNCGHIRGFEDMPYSS